VASVQHRFAARDGCRGRRRRSAVTGRRGGNSVLVAAGPGARRVTRGVWTINEIGEARTPRSAVRTPSLVVTDASH